ncbi:MAG: pyrimidine 5'-nucleotidase [Neomegalonema sp.]|nr:pyrimidine 5'-nucleotidase [Neomegalonema sp.]
MPKDAFAHVDVWIFDLDNTLYPPSSALFDQIHVKMTAFICQELEISPNEADALRAEYWRRYGTTLKGLMIEHEMAPEAFLEDVHDIDLTSIAPCEHLGPAIDALPGRKIVHTNGSRGHARRVLSQLQLQDRFEGVYAIEDTLFDPKPARVAYERVIAAAGFEPTKAAMIEDTEKNLREPHAMGMRTLLFHGAEPQTPEAEAQTQDHVHFTTDDLAAFLRRLAA